MPRVSIVIPAWRAAAYIGAAIESALRQSFTDYEILVVNDGSPDTAELERVLEPYRQRITYILRENGGPAAARNTAIRAARGHLIGLLDADDLWEPEFLAVQVAVLDRDPDADAVYADARIVGESSEAGRTFMSRWPSRGAVTLERVIRHECSVVACATLVRREAVLRAGMFDESLRGTEDMDLWLRILRQGGKIVYQHRVLASYRRHRGSLSADPAASSRGFLDVLDKFRQLPDLSAAERSLIEQQHVLETAMLNLHTGKQAFFAGDFDAATRHLRLANTRLKSFKVTLVIALLRIAPDMLRRAYRFRDRFIYKVNTEFD